MLVEVVVWARIAQLFKVIRKDEAVARKLVLILASI